MSDKPSGGGKPPRRDLNAGRSAGPPARKTPSAPNPHKAKAEELIRASGLPRPLAFQVAMGSLSLNDALQRLASEDRARQLVERHGLERSLAVQVSLGHADLDVVLAKKRLLQHLQLHRTRSILNEGLGAAGAPGPKVELALHGRRRAIGQVVGVDKYELDFQVDGAEQERIHKLQCKLGWHARDHDEVRRCITIDPAFDAVAEPLRRPQDRYPCPDKVIFGLIEAGGAVLARTVEGDVAHGVLRWIGRWELGMVAVRPGKKVKGKDLEGPELVVFRHALADLRSA